MKGFDCATPLTAETASKFKADGYEFVCRYLVPSGWKRLSKEEAELVSKAGLLLISVFETTADRALGGYTAGLADGATAAQVAYSLGQPEGSAIYFAVDFDATAAQMPTVIEYIRGASEATPKHSTGVYGSYNVVNKVRDASVCSKYWQTYAWSRGQLADWGINLYQYQNNITVNGIGVDLNTSYGNEGGWTLTPPEPPPAQKKTNFSDVEAGRWSEDVIWVVSNAGIMTGYEDGTFRPEQPVSREELAKVVSSLLYLINSK
jgi:hypothetical protein